MTKEAAAAFIVPSSTDCIKISKVIEDISDTMTLMEAKRDYINEAKKALKEKYDIPAPQISLMVKLYHSDKADDHFAETQTSEEFYDMLFNTSRS